jgi:putative two-component system response regulator
LLSGGTSELVQMAEEIALFHHERWDGNGYPCGLQADEIPLTARIVAVADTFDALIHERPYKEAWSVPQALAEIGRERGGQFDPRVVDALLRLHQRDMLGSPAERNPNIL